MTGDGAKMVNFGQKMTKHGRNVNVPKWKSSTKSNLCKKKPRPQFSKYCFQNESAWTQPTCPWVTGGRKKSYQACKMQNAKCKMQNAKSVLRVQRWLAPTCPWVTGGRRGLCLASREEAAASPGLQALETHNRESHLMKSVFFNSTLSFGRESLMLLTNGNIHPGEEARRRI